MMHNMKQCHLGVERNDDVVRYGRIIRNKPIQIQATAIQFMKSAINGPHPVKCQMSFPGPADVS